MIKDFPWMKVEVSQIHDDWFKPIISPFQIVSYHKYNVIPPTPEERFRQAIAMATKIVESWPKWKQDMLEDMMSPTVKTPRQTVNNNDWPDY